MTSSRKRRSCTFVVQIFGAYGADPGLHLTRFAPWSLWLILSWVPGRLRRGNDCVEDFGSDCREHGGRRTPELAVSSEQLARDAGLRDSSAPLRSGRNDIHLGVLGVLTVSLRLRGVAGAAYGAGTTASKTSVRIAASTAGSNPRAAHLSSRTLATMAKLSPEMPCWRESL